MPSHALPAHPDTRATDYMKLLEGEDTDPGGYTRRACVLTDAQWEAVQGSMGFQKGAQRTGFLSVLFLSLVDHTNTAIRRLHNLDSACFLSVLFLSPSLLLHLLLFGVAFSFAWCAFLRPRCVPAVALGFGADVSESGRRAGEIGCPRNVPLASCRDQDGCATSTGTHAQ
jgi:hypothetical protein